MTVEKLDPICDCTGEYLGMEEVAGGDYVRVADIIERLSAILSGSHTTPQFRVRVGDLLEELNN